MAVRTTSRPPGAPPTDGDGGGDGCPWAPRHLPCVTYTRRWRDRFRRRYWIRCFACDFRIGPFEVAAMANVERELLEGG